VAFIFRPTTAAAEFVRPYARRLASELQSTTPGAKNQVVDGYLLRAVRAGPNVIVYALDPEALWAFLHHTPVTGFGVHLKLATRRFARDVLRPDVAPAVSAVVVKSVDTALLPYNPGQGFYQTIDTGALFIRSNFPSVPYSHADRCGTCVLAATSGNVQALFATDRFQLWGDSFDSQQQPKFHKPGADTGGFAASGLRLLAWILPESGLQTLVGDANARLYTRQMSRYSYTIPVFAAQCSRDGFGSWEDIQTRWGEVVVGGAYVSQPNSTDTPPDPVTDPARLGIAGVFLAKLLRPPVPPAASYLLTQTASMNLLMTDNPEAELAPVLGTFGGVERYEAHGVSGSALCFSLDAGSDSPPDGAGSRGASCLFYSNFCNKSGVVWAGVQVLRITSAGVESVVTLHKSTDTTQYTIGPDVQAFGVDGVFGTRFAVGTGVQDQTTTELIHYGVDGVIRTTNLLSAGWYPFTQALLNPTGITAGTVFGQSTHFAASIGNNKVAVLARDYVVLGSDPSATWTLVVLDQTTGEFIEARGVVGTAATITYSAHISVVTPESVGVDMVVTPAVLLGTLDLKHYLSTDGGSTWTHVFEGFVGKPVYLGNQLHRIAFNNTI